MIKIEFKRKRGKGGIRVAPTTTKVDLNRMKIKEISLEPFSQLADLDFLVISNNKELEHLDLTPLSHCKKLRALLLSFNGLTSIDFSPLRELDNLEAIRLGGNQISTIDLEPLRGLTKFTTFNTELNPTSEIDVGPLVGCINLSAFRVTSGTALFVGDPNVKIEDLPEVLRKQMGGVTLLPYKKIDSGKSLDKSVVPFNTTTIDFSGLIQAGR